MNWKEAVMAYIQVTIPEFAEGTEKKHKKNCQNSQSLSQDLNPGPP
jgi:hypothetical protein